MKLHFITIIHFKQIAIDTLCYKGIDDFAVSSVTDKVDFLFLLEEELSGSNWDNKVIRSRTDHSGEKRRPFVFPFVKKAT